LMSLLFMVPLPVGLLDDMFVVFVMHSSGWLLV
jgi:hypothetical protein